MRSQRSRPKSHTITAEQLLEDYLAREAVDKLEKAGAPREELLKLVLSIPGASNQSEPLVRGVNERMLRALPDRIKAMADQTKKVNDSPWLTPNHLLHLDPRYLPSPLKEAATPERAKPTAEILSGIPSLLNFYAEHLRAWLDHFHPPRPRRLDVRDPRPPRKGRLYDDIRMRKLLTLRMMGLIRKHTGDPHHEDVATLLAEAYRVNGQADEGAKVNAEHLKKLEKNNRELYLIAYPFDL